MKRKAMVHSLGDMAEVEIIEWHGHNDIVCIYRGVKCSAIYNVFTGLIYVDDIYGVIEE